MGDASTARARTVPAARKSAAARTAAPRNAAKKAVPAARTPRKAAARKTTARRPDPAPTEPTALAEAIAARQAQPGFDADALLANSAPTAPRKTVPRKAAAKKTAAKKTAPAPAAKKAPAKKTPRKAAAKKPVKRPSAAKAGTTRAKKFTRVVKYARKHPFTASLAVLLVVTTVAWRGVKGGGRLIRNGVAKAWARGEDDRLNRRAAKQAAAVTAAGHKGCPACKGTGVLPKHNADGTWAGSVRCTPAAARRAAARRSA
ncbi:MULTISPECIES: hypothetical protein [unclassified Streptomyces]|uniref:hypothetical protein n=1 Tax=unclassified Streptomyces TaxID=2593676 RepID=UPI000F6D6E1D|nr:MULTISPECIES: hypothetical protein [unclassified Streptomyces]AZM65008.1 hypothetical protein DLM49_36535 [Streptomyces sp. WAC 01438]RSM85884.1 hypothetical protein DMA10_36800 [Streptomyces sp. WAC 01420]